MIGKELCSMHRMIKKIVIFILCFIIIFLLTEAFFYKQQKEHMWEYIYKEEDDNIDVLFLGSSLFFRSVDASFINETTGLKTGILGCGSMNLKIALNDLEIALKHKKVQVLVIDSNVALERLDYKKSQYGVLILHNDKIPNQLDRLKANFYEFPIKDFPAAMFQLCRPTLTWERYKKEEPKEINENWGYYPLYEMSKNLVEENYTPVMMQEDCNKNTDYYPLDEEETILWNELIVLAKEYDCKIWIVDMPRLDKDYAEKTIGKIPYIFEMAESQEVDKCIELNNELVTMGLEPTDFYDKMHLNVNGSRKFTQYFIENYIKPEFSIDSNYPSYGIKDETFEKVSNGYKYSLDTYGKCLFRFIYYRDNNIEKEWDISDTNYVLLPHELEENEKLYYQIISAETGDILKFGYFMKWRN